jgi:hypothetical protein
MKIKTSAIIAFVFSIFIPVAVIICEIAFKLDPYRNIEGSFGSFFTQIIDFLLLYGFFFPIIGIILGRAALANLKKKQGEGKGFAKAAIVIGIVSIIISLLAWVWSIVLRISFPSGYF